MRATPVFGLIVLACAPFISPAVAAEKKADVAVATYRGGSVTRGEFLGYHRRKLSQEDYAALLGDPRSRREGAERLAFLEIVRREAEKAGTFKNPVFMARLDDFENRRLADLYRKRIRDEVVVTDAMLDRMVQDEPGETQISWTQFPTEEEARAFIAALPGGKYEALRGKMAIERGYEHGETQLLEGGQSHFSAQSMAAIRALPPGGTSAPLPEVTGWYVVHVLRKLTPREKRQRARDAMRESVRKAKQGEAVAAKETELRKKATVTIDEQVLADSSPAAAGRVAAVVNGQLITLAGALPHGFPKHDELGEIRRKELEETILTLLLADEARHHGLQKKDPAWEEQRGYFTLDLLSELYLEAATAGATVSEEEAREYHAKNPELFESSPVVLVSHIVLSSGFLAERYRKDILAGKADFAAIAKLESEDKSTSDKGGQVGWYAENSLNSPFREVVEKLKPKQISSPVRSGEKYYLIRLDERREAAVVPYEQIRAQVLPRALLARKGEIIARLTSRLMQEGEVKVDEKALSSLAR